ncbi:MAG: transcription termination/antitermination protein NusG [Candidatus Margulisiibacteriota bacterium]
MEEHIEKKEEEKELEQEKVEETQPESGQIESSPGLDQPIEETASAEEPIEKKEEEQVEEKQPEPIALEAEPETEASDGDSRKKWYVIQAMTGQEDRVKQAIELSVKISGLVNKVFQILVPKEEMVEIKGGKRVVKVKTMFPGYVFLEMILDEESWYCIRETAGVSKFIGSKTKPTPVSGKEMQRVLKQLGREEKFEITFEKGEGVRIISGAFRGYTGTVDEVNGEKGKLKVLINIFGRDTPVEVNFEYAQKIV